MIGALSMVGLVAGPAGAAVAALGFAAVVLAQHRRARRRAQAARDRALPELVDLFVLAAAAGHPIHRCVQLVARRAPPAVRAPLATACVRVDRGASLADALHRAGGELGGLGQVLTDALVAALETGAPLVATLAGLAQAARDQRRRQAEEAARRLPVTLLVPLVCCILPAFGLLAVVPLLAASLAGLSA